MASNPAGDPRVPVATHLEPQAPHATTARMPLLTCLYDGEVAVEESGWDRDRGALVLLSASDEMGRKVSVYMSAETAWKFAEQIVTVVRNHDRGDATPASAVYQVTPVSSDTNKNPKEEQ